MQLGREVGNDREYVGSDVAVVVFFIVRNDFQNNSVLSVERQASSAGETLVAPCVFQMNSRHFVFVDLLQNLEPRIGVLKDFLEFGRVPVSDSFGILVFAQNAVKDIGTQSHHQFVHLIHALIHQVLFVPAMERRFKLLVGHFVTQPAHANVQILLERDFRVLVVANRALLHLLVMDALPMNLKECLTNIKEIHKQKRTYNMIKHVLLHLMRCKYKKEKIPFFCFFGCVF